jgi:hypothetical protein
MPGTPPGGVAGRCPDRIVTSGRLAPMPAITIANIGPSPTPAASSPAPIGKAASPRRYSGRPSTAASGSDHQVDVPRTPRASPRGTTPYSSAPTATPSSIGRSIGRSSATASPRRRRARPPPRPRRSGCRVVAVRATPARRRSAHGRSCPVPAHPARAPGTADPATGVGPRHDGPSARGGGRAQPAPTAHRGPSRCPRRPRRRPPWSRPEQQGDDRRGCRG